MRKFLILVTAVLFVILYSMPAMALFGPNVDVDVDIDGKVCVSNINKNINTNKNINIISNKLTQEQCQLQLQAQHQAQMQSANNEGVKQKVIFEQAETKRNFMNAGEIKYGKLGTFRESRRYGAEFTKFAAITKYKITYTYEHALKSYGKPYGKGKCITIGGSYNGRHEVNPTKEVTAITAKQFNPLIMEPIGFLTIKTNPKWINKWFVKSKDKQVDSFTVFQKAVLSACIMRGNYFMKIREGATFMSRNTGSGIGFNVSGGMVNDMANGHGRSGSTSGGTGTSSGSAWNRTLPYLVVQVFRHIE